MRTWSARGACGQALCGTCARAWPSTARPPGWPSSATPSTPPCPSRPRCSSGEHARTRLNRHPCKRLIGPLACILCWPHKPLEARSACSILGLCCRAAALILMPHCTTICGAATPHPVHCIPAGLARNTSCRWIYSRLGVCPTYVRTVLRYPAEGFACMHACSAHGLSRQNTFTAANRSGGKRALPEYAICAGRARTIRASCWA